MFARVRCACALLIVGLGVVLVPTADAQVNPLPPVGMYPTYGGAQLDGTWCVGGARNLASVLLRRNLPAVNVAADLWKPIPGFGQIANDGKKLCGYGAMIIYSKELGNTGHVCMCLGTVNPATRTVRVVDSNWHDPYDWKGRVHDISLNDKRILGWQVPN